MNLNSKSFYSERNNINNQNKIINNTQGNINNNVNNKLNDYYLEDEDSYTDGQNNQKEKEIKIKINNEIQNKNDQIGISNLPSNIYSKNSQSPVQACKNTKTNNGVNLMELNKKLKFMSPMTINNSDIISAQENKREVSLIIKDRDENSPDNLKDHFNTIIMKNSKVYMMNKKKINTCHS